MSEELDAAAQVAADAAAAEKAAEAEKAAAVEPEPVAETEPEPAAEPAQDPEAEPAAEPVPEEPKELDTAVWGDTGNEVGNSVLGMLQESGISTEDAKALMYDAVQAGDVTMIDKAALTEKVGANAANIILSGTETFIKENASKTAGIISEVHTAAGGEKNWDTVSTWAASNVSEADLAEYRPMIDKGGASARFAVGEILSAYNADSSNTTIKPAAPRAEPTSVSPPATVGTTRREYVAALEKAHRFGQPSAKELATIKAQRDAGRKSGI